MPAGVSVPANDLYPSNTLYPSEVTGIIISPGIPSRRAQGAQDGLPRAYRYPSDTSFPTASTDGLRIVPLELAVSYPSLPRFRFVGIPSANSLEYVPPPDFGPVGPPRRGLTPGVGKVPGPIVVGSDVDIPIQYRRAQYPSDSLYPNRGLYPPREDFTPIARTGHGTFKGRQKFLVVRNGRFRTFTVTFDAPVGHLSVHGVFSSDVSAIVPYVVELSDATLVGELEDGSYAAEFSLASSQVEMDELAFQVELGAADVFEVDL